MNKIRMNIKKILLCGLSFLILIAPISVQNLGGINIAEAQSLPTGYSATQCPQPATNGVWTCTTASGGFIQVNASGTQVNGDGTPYTGQNINISPNAAESAPSQDCTASVLSWTAFFSPSCWGPLIAGVVAEALVYITSSILAIAGGLFNWVLYETVLQFGQLINGGVSGNNPGIINGINTAWSVFRDLSNIVIIGMFTFMAIMTILGSTDYGYKKLLSRVLIVAIIINFSLLFTKIIIDVSNFTAVQFYSAASANNPNLQDNNPSQASQGQTGTAPQTGIAGAFMNYAGVQGLGDTANAVFALGSSPGSSAWWGLLYGVMTALLFLVAALVLFYGSFLLFSRAILMIFLMVTSSIAFASYLIPSLSQGNYGWNMWWQSLLKNAVFAPLLMVLLWVTLSIASGFQAASGTLGSAVLNPGAPPGISALFGYVVVIGLLFASFKIASSFSTSIGGFNFAQAIAGTPISLGSRFAGVLGQQTLGRLGARREESLKRQRDDAKAKGDEQLASRLNLRLDRSKRFGVASLGRKDFNLMNTSVGKVFAKSAGLSGILAGVTKGGGIKKRAEAAGKEGEKVGKELVLSSEQKDKIRQTAYEEKMQNRERDKQLLESTKKAQEDQLKIAKDTAEKQTSTLEHEKSTHEKRLEVEQKAQGDLKNKHDSILKSISEELGKHNEGTPERNDAEVRYQNAKLARDSEMAAQDEKIKTVRNEITAPIADLEKKIAEINAPVAALSKNVAETNSALKDFDTNYDLTAKEYGKKVADEAADRFKNAASDQAASYAQRRVSNLPFALSPGDDLFAREARGALKKGQKDHALQERLKAWRALDKADKEEGGHEEKADDDSH
jgi:hypothetical protein